MNVRVAAGPIAELDTEALVVLLPEGATSPAPADGAAAVLAGEVLRAGDFKGKPGDVVVLYATTGQARRLVLAGLGKADQLTPDRLRQAAGKAATTLRELGVKKLAFALPALDSLAWKRGVKALDGAGVAQAVAEGALLSLYQMNDYRTKDREEIKQIDAVSFWASAGFQGAEDGLKRAQYLAEAVNEARTLILHPGSVLTPARFAEEAKSLGAAAGLKVSVIERAELEKRGFGALLAVGQGSVQPPCLIVLEYRGGKPEEKPIAIVGKGITFDTGGIGIKPGPSMERMKYDMGGGAAALGILLAAARLQLPVNLVGVIAAAENMPSATAVKPGDVVTSYAGYTIEVNDTDAEGRVVLADALAYAVKDHQARAIVDMATLTGSIGVALGREVMGVLGNHQGLIDNLLRAGEHVGERGWQMPLFDEYDEVMKSDIADFKNYGGRWGDAVNATAFLKQFVGETPWVHLDIAGIGWSDKDKPYSPKGPTGAPIRAVVELLRHWQEPAAIQ